MVPEPQRKRRYVGSYELVKPLAQGGMAKLYLGRHATGRLAAIKILLERFDQKPKLRRRFFNEARIIASIHHPNVVELYEFGQTDRGSAYLVMEYLHGVTLDTYLCQRDHVAVRSSLAIAAQIASALAVVHEHGVVHRDLKPSNVMLVQSPETGETAAKVLDFGIAKLLDSDPNSTELTKTGVILGTPKYMSPEQCRADRDVDHRTDIYGLGIILYGLVTGAFPFGGKSSGELIGQHLHVPPRPPRACQPLIPHSLEQLVLRCLAKQRDERFQTMDELATALHAEMARFEPTLTWPLPRARSARPVPVTSSLSGTPEAVSPVEGFDDTGQTRQLATPPAAGEASAGGRVPSVAPDSPSVAPDSLPLASLSAVSSGAGVDSIEASDPAMLYTGESVRIRKGAGALWGALALVAVLAAALVLYEGGYLAALSGTSGKAENRASASGAAGESPAPPGKADPDSEAALVAAPDSDRAPGPGVAPAAESGEAEPADEAKPESDDQGARADAEGSGQGPGESQPVSERQSATSAPRRGSSRTRTHSSRRGKRRDKTTSVKSSSPEPSGSHQSTNSDDFEKPVF